MKSYVAQMCPLIFRAICWKIKKRGFIPTVMEYNENQAMVYSPDPEKSWMRLLVASKSHPVDQPLGMLSGMGALVPEHLLLSSRLTSKEDHLARKLLHQLFRQSSTSLP